MLQDHGNESIERKIIDDTGGRVRIAWIGERRMDQVTWTGGGNELG